MNNIFVSDDVFERIWNISILKKCALAHDEPPYGYVLGGQPGAGKSILGNAIVHYHKNNCIFFNGDEYRKYHPDYKKFQKENVFESSDKTQNFVSQVIEKIINRSKNERFNLIIEGTFRNPKVPISTLTKLNKAGYVTSAFIITAPKELTWESCLQRFNFRKDNFKGTERYTKKESHDEVVEKLPDSIETVIKSGQADFLKVFIRNNDNQFANIFDSRVHSRFDKEELRSFIQNGVVPSCLDAGFQERLSLGSMSVSDELVQKKLLALQNVKKSLNV